MWGGRPKTCFLLCIHLNLASVHPGSPPPYAAHASFSGVRQWRQLTQKREATLVSAFFWAVTHLSLSLRCPKCFAFGQSLLFPPPESNERANTSLDTGLAPTHTYTLKEKGQESVCAHFLRGTHLIVGRRRCDLTSPLASEEEEEEEEGEAGVVSFCSSHASGFFCHLLGTKLWGVSVDRPRERS